LAENEQNTPTILKTGETTNQRKTHTVRIFAAITITEFYFNHAPIGHSN